MRIEDMDILQIDEFDEDLHDLVEDLVDDFESVVRFLVTLSYAIEWSKRLHKVAPAVFRVEIGGLERYIVNGVPVWEIPAKFENLEEIASGTFAAADLEISVDSLVPLLVNYQNQALYELSKEQEQVFAKVVRAFLEQATNGENIEVDSAEMEYWLYTQSISTAPY